MTVANDRFALTATNGPALSTKRLVIAHVSVCVGCCCGQVDRGKPEVPVQWLKDEWRRRGLLKNIQLSISGCLGPCDIPNIIRIDTREETIWLAGITHFEQYRSIIEWMTLSKSSGRLLPMPREFRAHTLNPFR